MLDGLNSDPWGKPYKRVRNKVRPWAPPLTQTLDAGVVREVVAALFPTAPAQHQPPQMAPADAQGDVGEEAPEVGESELEEAVARLRRKSVAPGPDGIPGRAWVLAYEHLAPRVRGLFSACLAQALIPQRWKTGRLVLLRKEGRPAESPSAYRPIVLLDELAKLFERVVVGRLVAHLGQRGPDLSGVQFGFRSGRSTVDAILCVRAQVRDAVAQGDVVVAVSLDIANAFNTLPWSCIREALRYHGVPTYLRRVVGAYLSDRWVVFPGQNGMVSKEVVCGVPQGSVLGPLLWNIGYDWVLRGTLLRGVSVVCYADDTLVLARRPTYRDAAVLATAGVAQVVARIRRLGLTVALEKAEGIVFHGPRRAPPHDAHLIVGGTRIGLSGAMTYLGLVLDGRWKFRAHFQRLVPRLLKVAASLSWLLPNVGGPGVSCRRLYTGVVRSMAMYGAPVWADALDRENIALLRRAQRVMAIRVVRGYRTISGEAACVLAGVLPWDLDAVSLASSYRRRRGLASGTLSPAPRGLQDHLRRERDAAIAEWEGRLERPSAGHRTIEAIRPVLRQWLARRHGVLTFRATQVLSGHGCFGGYLCRVAGREPSPRCHHCRDCSDESAQHVLEVCPAWEEEREALKRVVGTDLSLPAVISAMVGSERCWDAVLAFCERVMSEKEAAERVREDTTDLPLRRKRTGRRRQAHDRRLPP
ncbi:unnamed protein product [Euphydryas editha]|uniref:Reverse transcriptase domain-containing protein n=2 Tax=Euphydryas editha TaxID=104508 RepID=A0AAU9U039_EUPED|nr:unnamed protein product [Euphydryas editha]